MTIKKREKRDEYISVREAARRLNVTPTWLRRRMTDHKQMPPIPPAKAKAGYNWRLLQAWWKKCDKAVIERKRESARAQAEMAENNPEAAGKVRQLELRCRLLEIEIAKLEEELLPRSQLREQLEGHAHIVLNALKSWQEQVGATFRDAEIMQLAERTVDAVRMRLAADCRAAGDAE